MSTRPTRRAAAKRKQIIEEDSDDEINDSPAAESEEEEESEDDFTPAPKSVPRKSIGRGRRQTTQPPAATDAAPTDAAIDTPPSGSSAGRKVARARKSVAPRASIATDAATDAVSTPTAPPARRRGRPSKNVVKEESVEPEGVTAPIAESEPEPTIEPTTEADAEEEQDENVEPDDTAMDVDEEEEKPAKKKPAGRKRKSVAPAAPAPPAKTPTPARQTPAPELQPPSPEDLLATPRPAGSPVDQFQTPLADITEAVGNDQRRPIEDTVLLNTVKPIRALDTVMDKPMDIVLKSRTMAIPQVEDTTPKPRLVITYLILNNFKSYAGRQEVGPFHASFSSVVGPNGSGKSNVIDSLLFVFGFRASKMRQGKLSALIHNSAQFPNLDFCEVAVHFQEVMDQVWTSTDRPYPFRCCANLVFNSLVAATRSFLTPHSSFHARPSRTTPAAITSMAKRPTLRPSQPCSGIVVSIWTTNVS